MKTPTEFTFTFSAEEAQTILNILAEKPFKDVSAIVFSIQKQATAQTEALNAPADDNGVAKRTPSLATTGGSRK